MPGNGNRIKISREKSKLTQQELSDAAGISLPSVRSYEQGVRKPKIETWKKLANALGVSVDYLRGVAVSREDFEASVIKYIRQAISQAPDGTLGKALDEYLRVVTPYVSIDSDTGKQIYSTTDDLQGGMDWLLEQDNADEIIHSVLSDDVLPVITTELYPRYPNGLKDYGSYDETIPPDEYTGDPYTTPEIEIAAILTRFRNAQAHGIDLEDRSTPIEFRGKLLTDKERDHVISDVADMRGIHLEGDD
ncbi:helix-turn-helix domain-containing protein [Lacticaseibacillus sp. 866-1]|uniref:helix-turn-helix domain-containing protein n=1 Tax=Lacticaseibacillus sp. 866-1 TaxID=2799576 RepID=UPI001942FE6F|nr:helix-turn-helix transcriptional regulator [Lacticaseibacillus sp. 866-1]